MKDLPEKVHRRFGLTFGGEVVCELGEVVADGAAFCSPFHVLALSRGPRRQEQPRVASRPFQANVALECTHHTWGQVLGEIAIDLGGPVLWANEMVLAIIHQRLPHVLVLHLGPFRGSASEPIVEDDADDSGVGEGLLLRREELALAGVLPQHQEGALGLLDASPDIKPRGEIFVPLKVLRPLPPGAHLRVCLRLLHRSVASEVVVQHLVVLVARTPRARGIQDVSPLGFPRLELGEGHLGGDHLPGPGHSAIHDGEVQDLHTHAHTHTHTHTHTKHKHKHKHEH